MSVYISLLRGINVGGQKKLPMESLRKIYEADGFSRVRTYVQSGNVVFEAGQSNPSKVRKQLEEAIEAACRFHVPVFILQAEDLERLLRNNPFISTRQEDPRWLHVTFLYETPSPQSWEKLVAPARISDEFASDKSAIFLFCPNGYGKTKLSNAFFERKLGMLATTRNWNTVNALYGMVTKD